MARMSIYVPDSLKRRMDPLSDRVNWSGIAQAAFETELRLYPEWKEDQMTTVIERLRASKQKLSKNDLQWGIGAGQSWAENKAEYIELKRVAGLNDPDDDDEFEFDDLPRLLDPEGEMSYHDFWESILGHDARDWSSAFQVGFIRGAKSVWSKIEDQV